MKERIIMISFNKITKKETNAKRKCEKKMQNM